MLSRHVLHAGLGKESSVPKIPTRTVFYFCISTVSYERRLRDMKHLYSATATGIAAAPGPPMLYLLLSR